MSVRGSGLRTFVERDSGGFQLSLQVWKLGVELLRRLGVHASVAGVKGS